MEWHQSNRFTLSLTQEQVQFIESIWEARGWDLNLDQVESDRPSYTTTGIQSTEKHGSCEHCGALTVPASESTDNETIDNNGCAYHIEGDNTQEECPWCPCQPCVTDISSKQLWWESECRASNAENSKLWKNHYQRFWVMLLHRGAWNKDAYKQKKSAAMRSRSVHAWVGPNTKHPRDIMPDCVLSMVRKWLPNPATVPYMGHKWSWNMYHYTIRYASRLFHFKFVSTLYSIHWRNWYTNDEA